MEAGERPLSQGQRSREGWPLTNGGCGHHLPPGLRMFSSQTWAPQNTSWLWRGADVRCGQLALGQPLYPRSQLPKLTGLGSDSWHQYPGRSAGCQQSSREQICGWILYPEQPQTPPGPPWFCLLHCRERQGNMGKVKTWMMMLVQD